MFKYKAEMVTVPDFADFPHLLPEV